MPVLLLGEWSPATGSPIWPTRHATTVVLGALASRDGVPCHDKDSPSTATAPDLLTRPNQRWLSVLTD